MKYIPLIMAIAFALCSCASDGSYDPAAANQTIQALGSAYDTGSRVYRDYRSGYAQPTYVAPVQPLPVYPAVYP